MKCKQRSKSAYRKCRWQASFTIEAAFVVPIVILVLMLGLHIAYELQDTTIAEAKKEPSVQSVDPIAEIYDGMK